MQTVISLGGRTVVAGLNWTVLGAASTRKKDIKKACAETGLKFGVLAVGNDVSAIGLCAKKFDHPSAAALLSAANLADSKSKGFAESGGAWILVEKVRSSDKDLYWLCAIADGVPVPGTDIVEELTVISAKLAELIEILEEVEIFSPNEEVQEYVATGNFQTNNQSFEDVVEKVSLPKGGKPQKQEGVPESLLIALGAVAVGIIGIAGYSYWADYSGKQEALQKQQKAKQAKEMALQLEQQKAQAEYQQGLSKAKESLLKQVNDSLSLKPIVVVSAWYKVLENIPVNYGGWQLNKVECSPTECKFSLTRLPMYGTNMSLLEIIPSAVINKESAEYEIPITLDEGQRVPADFNKLRTPQEFNRVAVSKLQELRKFGTDTLLGDPKELTYQPPAVKTPDGKTLPTKPESIGVSKGPFALGRQGVWLLPSLDIVFENVPELVVDKLEVGFPQAITGDASWKITGSYYLKTGK